MLKLISQPRHYSVHGAHFEALAAPSSGSRENCAWIVSLPPGAQGKPHAVTREEIFVALEGCARVCSGGEVLELRAGAALLVPPGTEFALENPAAETFRAIAIMPVGGAAVLPGGLPFTPHWTQ